MKKLHIVGNWKMTLNKEDSIALAEKIKTISKKDNLNIEVAPTSLYINDILKILKESDINVISQNFDFESLGSFTGGICLDQLIELGVSKSILGHSERRSKFNESDDQINSKLETVLKSQLDVIFCFDSYDQVPFDLIKNNLNDNSKIKLTLAYEPTWAIGTGKTASIDHIVEIHTKVKNTLTEYSLQNVPILYGGSVNPSNSRDILSSNNVDGVLVGGASTKFDQLLGIVNSI
ncbi:MAG: triose-phosphate isomerase [Flavobacteriaceae bacterium]|nr:triose-phosphate isomerase [Flavobacteriaceae bacterium]|tara:strand:+ start:548 stop:1249 length:702 start_codon:yes stop_codon:yes gene_type:complete